MLKENKDEKGKQKKKKAKKRNDLTAASDRLSDSMGAWGTCVLVGWLPSFLKVHEGTQLPFPQGSVHDAMRDSDTTPP